MALLELSMPMAPRIYFMVLTLFLVDGYAAPIHEPGSTPLTHYVCTCQSTSCGGIRWSLDGEQLTEEHHYVSRIIFNSRSLTGHLWLTGLTSELDNTFLVCTEDESGVEIRAWTLETLPNLDPELITVSSTQEDFNIYLPPFNYSGSYCVRVPNTSYISCNSSHHLQVPREVCSDVCADCTVQIWGQGSTVELSLWTEMDVNVTGLETDAEGYMTFEVDQPICNASISIADRDIGHSRMYTTTSLNTTANVMRFQVGELVRGHTYDVEIWVTNGGGSSLHRKLFVCCTHDEGGVTQNPPLSNKASNLDTRHVVLTVLLPAIVAVII